MLSHERFKAKMLANSAVKEEYERLADEFVIIEELIKARLRSGLSQAEIARRMGTKPPAISRIESSDPKHSPSVRTLTRYAKAIGCKLELKLKPLRVS